MTEHRRPPAPSAPGSPRRTGTSATRGESSSGRQSRTASSRPRSPSSRRAGARPRVRRGAERRLAGGARLAGDGGRLLSSGPREGPRARCLARRRGRVGARRRPRVHARAACVRPRRRCLLQVPRDELDVALRQAADAVAPGGTLVVLGHDTTNLTDGHGGPKDVAVLFTPEDVDRLARWARRRAGGEGAAPGVARRPARRSPSTRSSGPAGRGRLDPRRRHGGS